MKTFTLHVVVFFRTVYCYEQLGTSSVILMHLSVSYQKSVLFVYVCLSVTSGETSPAASSEDTGAESWASRQDLWTAAKVRGDKVRAETEEHWSGRTKGDLHQQIWWTKWGWWDTLSKLNLAKFGVIMELKTRTSLYANNTIGLVAQFVHWHALIWQSADDSVPWEIHMFVSLKHKFWDFVGFSETFLSLYHLSSSKLDYLFWI